jgi:broad specificity phosphatase PhoE
MTFFLMRHGRKAAGKFYNPALRHQDPPLDAEGIAAARKWTGGLAGRTFDALYVSGYLRTRQTAAPLAELLRLDPLEDPRLNELDNGLLDDMSEREFEAAYPGVWKAYAARTADFRFPGGETGAEARARIGSFLEEKRRLHAGGNVLAVTHDGLIRIAMTLVLGMPVWRRGDFKVDLCGLTEIAFQEDVRRWKLIRFNHTLA